MNVVKQAGGCDCGVFAKAYATTSLVPGAEEERLVHTDALPVN